MATTTELVHQDSPLAGNEHATPARTPAARKPRRRGHGEGSLYQRPQDGRWIGRLMVGCKPDGTPDRRVVSGKTRAEAQKKLDELRRRAEGGLLGDAKADRQTVAAFLERWLEATEGTVRASTWRRYRQFVTHQLAPGLGQQKLAALRPEHLQQFYKRMAAAGLAPRTVHHLHAVLHRALGQAVRWGMASRNVADAVDPPRVPHKEVAPPATEALVRLLDAAEAAGDPLHAMWVVAVYTGLRRGELLGLQWPAVDLDAGSLTVRQALIGVQGGVPTFGEPKSARSRRTIALPAEAVAALRRHRQRQLEERLALGPSYAAYDLVFCTRLGTALLARNVTRSFKAALARADLAASIRLHDLRHASATLLLAAKVDIKTASARLGHSTIGITGDLYAHAVADLDVEAARKLQEALRGAATPASAGGARG